MDSAAATRDHVMSSENDVNHMHSVGLESNITTAANDKLFYYHRGLVTASDENPILVLIHGYPQTNFMWRHLIPLLPPQLPLFIPDIPGYGRSTPLTSPHSKHNQGLSILQQLSRILPSTLPTSLILCGHDRGARIIHRLSVDTDICLSLGFKILGSIFIDIVPTLTQWQSFSSASAATGTFHWPFLANVEVATEMIGKMGGDVWCKMLIYRWAGKSTSSIDQLEKNDAVSVYAESFRSESVIRASCDDYRAGAEEDVVAQEEDQRRGRKVDCDVLVLFSQDYLGKRYDLEKVWSEWIGKGGLEVKGLGDGCGHFIVEEKPEETADAVVKFYNRLAATA